MTIWHAILLGLVQGLTEFLPISSTAHLTLTGKVFGLVNPDRPDEWTAFIAVIQLGTLISVIIYFWADIVAITRGFLTTNVALVTRRRPDHESAQQAKLGWLVIIGTLPIAIVGLTFKDIIEGSLTKNLWVISASLIGLAIVLTIAEFASPKRRGMEDLRYRDAVAVGIAQVFALVPGSSRSGTTITGGLFSGLTRETAARFSFLLSIPAVAASGLLELPKAFSSLHTDWVNIVIATVVSAVSGYLAIAFLLKFLQRHTTFIFVAYRIILGLILIALLVTSRVGAN